MANTLGFITGLPVEKRAKAKAGSPDRHVGYEDDFYLWTQQQAKLLGERRFDQLDLENLIDEVASVGISDKREIRKRLKVLLAQLLKWKYQPGARSSGWRGTIDHQRQEIKSVIKDSPSLKPYPDDVFLDAYLGARLLAAKETGIDFTLFPEVPPFTGSEALDENYLPKEPDLIQQNTK